MPLHLDYECSAEDADAAGLSCSEAEPCPVFLELSGVEAAGNRIFLSGDIHFAGATLWSVLLSSSDAGKTWTESYPRIRFAALDQIQFIDFANGWISGANALASPRDPFFLITNDGGNTWHQRMISDESQPGVIEKFWFDSKTNGTMLINSRYENRYELYETNTGGESWSMREKSDKPIRFPRNIEIGSSGWRLRADARTQSFALERSDGTHWQKVAGFLIHLGDCKE